MRNELNLWVAGGDMRQAKLAELLAADGHTVHAYALERLGALDGVEMEESLEGAALADCVVRPAKLIVAQRVSTILDADLILVLDEGRLVGAGTHGELLETCPVYRAIADSQMQREGA